MSKHVETLLPQGWRWQRLKYLIADSRNGIWGDDADGGPDDIACARVADFDRQRFYVKLPLQTFRKIGSEQLRGRVLSRGDLLLEKSGGGELTSVGAVVQFDGEEPAVCSNFVAVVKAANGVNARWLCYLNAHLYSAGVNRRSIKQTTGIQNLDSAQYFDEVVSVPPTADQPQIAVFLDRETARIDALIEKKTRFIQLLREKRQAESTELITRGLNAHLPMKDSDISFIGEVPAHWNIKPLKYLAGGMTVGIVVNPSDYVTDEGRPYFYGGDISDGKLNLQTCRRISNEHSRANAKTRLHAGDLVTVRVGAPGVTAVVPPEAEGGNCASVMLIRRGQFNSDWLCFVMNSRLVRYQVELVQYGAAQEQFNIGHAVDFLIPVPPVEEQRHLAEVLKARNARLDGMSRRIDRSIDLLRERRAALITAAVTGQIDLRTAQPISTLETA